MIIMAKQCSLCGKKSTMVGHYKKLMASYNPTGKKRKYPNLQKTTLPNGKKALVCTKCIKTMAKTGV